MIWNQFKETRFLKEVSNLWPQVVLKMGVR